MGKNWIEYQCKSGQTLFVYNKETGEHKWLFRLDEGIEYKIMHGRPVVYRELSTTATQTDDNGCNNRCMSMYVNIDKRCVSNISDITLPQEQPGVPNKEHILNKEPGLANVINLEQEQEQLQHDKSSMLMSINAAQSHVADNVDTTPCQQQPCVVNEQTNLNSQAGSDCYDDLVYFYDYFDHDGNDCNNKEENSSNDTSDESTLPQPSDVQNGESNLNSKSTFLKNTFKLEGTVEQEKVQFGMVTSYRSNVMENSCSYKDYNHDNNHSENSLRCADDQVDKQNLHKISEISNNLPKVKPSAEIKGDRSNGNQADDYLKQFKCSYCMKKFRFKCNLKKHERIHTNVKPFECTYCKKRFTQSSHLNIHLKHHTGERPFECSVCHEKFIQKCHLTSHVKTHTGHGEQFECSVCKKTFTRKYTMRLHLRLQHNSL